jgi:hypothetical protein
MGDYGFTSLGRWQAVGADALTLVILDAALPRSAEDDENTNSKDRLMSRISEALTRLLPMQRRAPSGRLAERESPGTNKTPALGGRLREAESPSANKEEKGSVTGSLVAYQNLGEPVWAPRDYATFAREGFMQNAIVYRSVRMIAEAAASIPLLLYSGTDEIEDHPLLDLIRRPSLDHTGTDFLESWYGFLLVAGNAYAEAVAIDGDVRELHILRPDRMKVIPGTDGWPEGYEYTASGRSVRFVNDVLDGVRPILHVRLFHPANDHYGMSPIEAAAIGSRSVVDLIDDYAEARRSRYRALPHFWRFGRGWLKRVDATLVLGRAWAGAEATNRGLLEPVQIAKGELEMDNGMTDATATDDASKWWAHSKTMWGTLITAAATVIRVLGPALGITLPAEVITTFGDQAVTAVQALTGLFGTVLAIYGRLNAASALTLRKG